MASWRPAASTRFGWLLDNAATHKTALIKRWLLKQPRVHLHFTPTSSAWINLVQCWFSILQRRELARGAFRTTQALEKSLRDDVALNNVDPKRFVWTKSADDILASVSRFCQRTSGSDHYYPARWSTDMWVPLAIDSAQRTRRGSHFMNVIGRLKPGVPRERAEAQLNGVAARLPTAYPAEQAERSARVTLMPENIVSGTRPALLVLLGAVGFVLLISCANVANLLLVGASARRHQVAIRTAMGASRGRLVRRRLMESLVLAFGGAALGAQARDAVGLVMRQGAMLTARGVALGLLGAFAFTRLLHSFLYGVSARDPLTFAVVAAVLSAVALIAAHVPARRASRADPLLAIRNE